MSVEDFLSGLNDGQRAAAEATEGPVEVIAGAGTGKTRALVARYCHLVRDLGIAPAAIVCATFTNRAANEMKRRVRVLLGDLDLGRISTIHAFCVQFLREEIHVLHYPKEFIVLDVDDQRAMLGKIFHDMGLTIRDMTIQEAVDDVLEAFKFLADSYVELFLAPDEAALRASYAPGDRKREIFARFLWEQKKCGGLDFNDLINFTSYILRKFPDVRARWQERVEYVMMDEFQDVSQRQYDIAKMLSGRTKNLFVVGDPDQTIYTWRGSHVKMMTNFPSRHAGTNLIKLAENYRSMPEILAAANALIRNNSQRFENPLNALRPSGPKPHFHHAKGEQEEAAFIVGRIGGKIAAGADPRAFAVLYRAHHQSRALEEALAAAKIPYRVFGGVPFYGRAEIRDVVAYLRMVAAGDDWSFRRTVNMPPRKFGSKKMAELERRAAAAKTTLYRTLLESRADPAWKGSEIGRYLEAIEAVKGMRNVRLDDRLAKLLDLSGYGAWLKLQNDQDRLDNVAELQRAVKTAAEDPDGTLEGFLATAALAVDAEREGHDKAVTLMTVHAAKGMEFADVTVCGLDEGVFPTRRAATLDDMEEERRLAYVAVTRAKDVLTLTDSEGQASDGVFKYPSRFVFEMGTALDFDAPLDKGLADAAKKLIGANENKLKAQADLLAVGTRVRHAYFGAGQIIDVKPSASVYIIKFDKLPATRQIVFGTKLDLA